MLVEPKGQGHLEETAISMAGQPCRNWSSSIPLLLPEVPPEADWEEREEALARLISLFSPQIFYGYEKQGNAACSIISASFHPHSTPSQTKQIEEGQ